MRDADWADPERQTLGVLFDGQAISELDDQGRTITGDTLLVVLSAAAAEVAFTLPGMDDGDGWELVVDTAQPTVTGSRHAARSAFVLIAHSAAVFRLTSGLNLEPEPAKGSSAAGRTRR